MRGATEQVQLTKADWYKFQLEETAPGHNTLLARWVVILILMTSGSSSRYDIMLVHGGIAYEIFWIYRAT